MHIVSVKVLHVCCLLTHTHVHTHTHTHTLTLSANPMREISESVHVETKG